MEVTLAQGDAGRTFVVLLARFAFVLPDSSPRLPEDYPTSRAAAKLLHVKYPCAQGIRWTSRRYSPADCVLLFGDRVLHAADDLLVEDPALRDLHEPGTPGFASLQAVMFEAGITPSP